MKLRCVSQTASVREVRGRRGRREPRGRRPPGAAERWPRGRRSAGPGGQTGDLLFYGTTQDATGYRRVAWRVVERRTWRRASRRGIGRRLTGRAASCGGAPCGAAALLMIYEAKSVGGPRVRPRDADDAA